jgi:hypothetical protein
VVTVKPVEGAYPGMPADRGYEIRLRGTLPPVRIAVNGRAAAFVADPDARALEFRLTRPADGRPGPQWWFDGQSGTTVVSVPWTKISAGVELRVAPSAVPAPLALLADGLPGVLARLHDLHDLVNRGWPKAVPPDLLLNLAQTGNRMSLKPETALDELAALAKGLPQLARVIAKLELTPEARSRAGALLGQMEFR